GPARSVPAAAPEGAAGAGDEEVRRLLGTVDLAALRASGLLDRLLELAAPAPAQGTTSAPATAAPATPATPAGDQGTDQGDSILTMTIDDLVRAALGRDGDN
ncbi:hypothetical protein AB0E96_37565, partial [Kitasatospora sp. NPDC036755]|uniref:hypothetical protein n=1 Tax=Kitasatospora sp. NPDC036755 TaxID=3154600 RepID=UPI0033D33F68